MIQRVAAAQATLDAYVGQPLVWGRTDCVRMAAFNLRKLGYRPRLARGGSYSSALGARRALKRAGFDRLEDALQDLGLVEIGHASHLPADILALESGDDWPALGVALGNRRVLAFSVHDGCAGVAGVKHEDIRSAWRAHPWPQR